MSWQGYVDSSLCGSPHIDKAAIFSAAGDSVWAATPGYHIKPEEIRAVIEGIKKEGVDKLYGSGVHLAGEKFVIVGEVKPEEQVCGRKGKQGVVICSTKQAIIVAHHPESAQLPDAIGVVESLVNYLVGLGY